MRPTRNSKSKFALTLAMLSAIATASAHSVSLSTGTLEIRPDQILLTLDIPGEDILHSFRPTPDEQSRIAAETFTDCIARYADCLLRDVVLRDAAGNRLTGRVTATRHEVQPGTPHDYGALRRARITYELRYPLAEPPRVLTLQQLMLTESVSHNSQLALAVLYTDHNVAFTIPLTNRGNVETLALDWPADVSPLLRRRSEPVVIVHPRLMDELKSVRATITIADTEVRIAIAVPLLLLETWQPLARADRDFLTLAERNAAWLSLEHFLAGRNQVRIDGRFVLPVDVTIQFVGPLDSGSNAPRASGERQSAHTSRVLATLHYPTGAPPTDLTLTWDLFNNAVLDAQATLLANGRESHHTLTTYNPHLNWSRPN